MPKPMISGPYRTFRRLNPDQAFLEFEGSTITIPMRGRRLAGRAMDGRRYPAAGLHAA